MAYTESTMLALGSKAPDFTLPAPALGIVLSLSECKGTQGTVVIFMCNHCPYVIHVIDQLVTLAAQYQPQGIGFVGINSNNVEKYPDDSPENMILFTQQHKIDFPYLYDESQLVALAYDAACTPDFYLFDNEGYLVYRGQFDASRPSNGKEVTGADLKNAIDHLLRGEEISQIQYPGGGCNIKWK